MVDFSCCSPGSEKSKLATATVEEVAPEEKTLAPESQAEEQTAAPSCGTGAEEGPSCGPRASDSIAELEATAEGRERRYKGLLSYIVSNAIAGEIMAVDNYSEMIPLIEDTEEKVVTAKQVYDESKHIRLLAKLGDRVGFNVKQVIVEPQWLNIRKVFHEAVSNGDLTSCYLMQDLMTETLAVVLYRTLQRGTDEATAATASNILQDEIRHLGIGIDRIHAMMDKDSDHVHDRLVWSHNKVIPELFSMISYHCYSLCGELDVECGILGLDSIKSDLDVVHEEATETYVETLERCEFDPKVTMPLIANIP